MRIFTKQEQTALAYFALILCAGSLLQYAFKKYPNLPDIVNLIDSDALYKKVDVNTASAEELTELPYIGEYTAANIVRYRREYGPFRRLEDLKQVKGIRDKNYQRFYPYLRKLD